MKKIATILLILTFALAGCAGLQFKTDDLATKKVLVLATARVAGYELAKKEPKYTDTALMLCDKLVAADNSSTVDMIMDQIMLYAAKDPLIALTVRDILSLVEIKVDVPINADQLVLVKAAAQGFKEGTLLGIGKPLQ